MQPAVRMFRDVIVRPVLRDLALSTYPAEMLVLGTIAQESNFKYLEQLSGGPGIGLGQMEPATHDDLWSNWLSRRRHWARSAARWASEDLPDASEMA